MTKNYIPTINISSLIKNNFETQSALKTIKEIEKACVKIGFFQAEDGIRDSSTSRGLGDVYKRQYKSLLPVGCAFFYAASMTITKYTSDKDDVNTQLFLSLIHI